MLRIYSDGLNPPPSFNLVYQAAYLQSDVHLTMYLNQSVASVDVKVGGKFGVITPAGLHAMHAHDDAVAFLVRYKANINFIGFGAALANRVETAEYWRKYHGAHPDMLARGAAYAGNIEYARRLNMLNGANNIEIGIGLVMGAHHALFKSWLQQDNVIINNDDLTELAIAAGIAGSYVPELTDLLTDMPDIGFSAMNTGAAIAGRSLFNQSRITMLPGVDTGLIAGGHLELLPADACETLDLIRLAWRSSNVDFILMYQARSLQMKRELEYALPSIAKAIADSNDVNLITHVIQRHPELLPEVRPTYFFLYNNARNFQHLSYLYNLNPSIKESVKEYIMQIRLLPNTAMALHCLVFYSNAAFNALILEVVGDDEDMKNRITHWMKQAEYMRQLMHRYELNFDQALAILTSADLRHLLLQTVKDINTCFPVLPLDMKAVIITHLSKLTLADAKDIIFKVRHYNLIVSDIWKIAAEFQLYAVNIESPLRERASSLSSLLYSVRQLNMASDILLKEFEFVLDIEATHLEENVLAEEGLISKKFGMFSDAATVACEAETKPHTQQLEHFDTNYNSLVLTQVNKITHKMRNYN